MRVKYISKSHTFLPVVESGACQIPSTSKLSFRAVLVLQLKSRMLRFDFCCVALVALVLSMSVGPIMGFIHRSRHLRDTFPKILGAFVLVMTLVSCTNPPYSSIRPKRLFLQHTVRRFPDGSTDSGVWVNPLDGLAMKPLLDIELPSLKDAKEIPCQGISCDLPWYLPMSRTVLGGWYVPVVALCTGSSYSFRARICVST